MDNGISFVCRVRNEENTLKECLESLKNMTVSYEIVVILHLCTDKSKEIAESVAENQPVIIREYKYSISRAGYENLATAGNSKQSLSGYNNWCMKHAKYRWKVKWDADFVASPTFVKELCTHPAVLDGKSRPSGFRIDANNGRSNVEMYAMNCFTSYKKHIFWEILTIPRNIKVYRFKSKIKHISPLTQVKSYWDSTPWFEEGDSEEARTVRRKVMFLNSLMIEIPGSHRAGNPLSIKYERLVRSVESQLRVHGITFKH
jgi:glycosyltransferase involved in cell wall biosynthesis